MRKEGFRVIGSLPNEVTREALGVYRDRDNVNGERIFTEFMHGVVASFHLPDVDSPMNVMLEGEIRTDVMMLPFPSIRICVRFALANGAFGEEETIINAEINNGETTYRWIDRTRDAITGRVEYHGSHAKRLDVGTVIMPTTFLRLINVLLDRKNGYVERGASRQVRRAMGLSPYYREYIVVSRRENPGCQTIGQVIRRHPRLHAVRGHLRQIRSGRLVSVKAHVRGHGEVFQVKDYVVK